MKAHSFVIASILFLAFPGCSRTKIEDLNTRLTIEADPTDQGEAPSGPALPVGELPLLQKDNIKYLGAFRVPNGNLGTSSFAYGGHALAYNPANDSLFMGSHDWHQQLGEVKVPDTINLSSTASVLQLPSDATEGGLKQIGPRTNKLGGALVFNNRLLITGYIYYGPDGAQTLAFGASNLDLSIPGDFKGFYSVAAAAPARAISGFMTPIPPEWQARFGGKALSGHCCSPGNQNTSNGPAATVFDPDDVGVVDPVPGTTLLYYPMSHPLGPYTSQNDYYNLATQMGGMAFPKGSRSVLFFGRQGVGPYCYGPGTTDPSLAGQPTEGGTWCYDLQDATKGTHAFPYRHQVWAYDALDLLEVKNGTKKSWEIRPYAIWTLPEMNASNRATIKGAAYDAINGRVFITEAYADFPIVHVYKVNIN